MINLEFEYVGIDIDRPGLDFMLNNPQGEVGQWLRRKGRWMVLLAKNQAPVQTGKLKSSIELIHNRVSNGQEILYGSRVDYAYSVHEGTGPRIITPKEAGILRFSAGGRMVYTHKVNHPGTAPNHYLSDQLWVLKV